MSRPAKGMGSNLSLVKIYNSQVYFDFRLNWSPKNEVQNGALLNQGQDQNQNQDQDQVQDQARKISVSQETNFLTI